MNTFRIRLEGVLDAVIVRGSLATLGTSHLDISRNGSVAFRAAWKNVVSFEALEPEPEDGSNDAATVVATPVIDLRTPGATGFRALPTDRDNGSTFVDSAPGRFGIYDGAMKLRFVGDFDSGRAARTFAAWVEEITAGI